MEEKGSPEQVVKSIKRAFRKGVLPYWKEIEKEQREARERNRKPNPQKMEKSRTFFQPPTNLPKDWRNRIIKA